MHPKLLKWLAVAAAIYLIVVGAFGAGWLVRHKDLWPNREITNTAQTLKRFAETQELVPNGLLHPRPSGPDGGWFDIRDPGRYLAGFRPVMGWDAGAGQFAIWLFDPAGEIRHRWPIDLDRLAIARIASEGLTPHGMAVLPDGDVLVNFSTGADAIVRLDGCGAPVWRRDGAFHHSIHLTGEGGLWTLENDVDPRDMTLRLAELDVATGETRRSIALFDDVFRDNSENAMVLRLPESFDPGPVAGRGAYIEGRDLWHANDVKPLGAARAPAFPMFAPGDLLISLRNIDLIAVLDPERLVFKWWQWGPWRAQHDPEFGPDGRIWVFNNATGLGRSDVVAVDPATGATERYFSSGDLAFYTEAQGQLAILAPDLLQLVIPFEGRVVEATLAGEIVLEINNIAKKATNARVMNAAYLPPDYFEAMPSCP
ncbi:MAG: arylsulfotransferase family protein [Pseudomonadota bacterium]